VTKGGLIVRLRVRIDKTQTEHNGSAYPRIAHMGADIVDGSEVPRTDIAAVGALAPPEVWNGLAKGSI
jgi:hypothetical protein